MNSHPQSRSVAALLVGLSLALAACGTVAESDDPGALPEDIVGVTEEEPEGPSDEESTDDDAEPEPVVDGDPDTDDPDTDDPERADPDDAPATSPAAGDSGAETPTTSGGSTGPAGDDFDCSGQTGEVEIAPAGELPAEVAALREFLIDAALRCDEQLLYTAMEESDAFNSTFGSETDALALWWDLEEAGEEPFLRLAQVLATTPALADGGEVYVWPQVTTGRSDNTTDAAWDELTWLDDPAAARAQGDGYLDWRAGISSDGQWRFFVRGD